MRATSAIKKPPADVTARLVKLKLRTETVVGFTCQAKDGKHYEWPGSEVAAKIAACAKEKTESDACANVRDEMRFTPFSLSATKGLESRSNARSSTRPTEYRKRS